jgi:hypothetical protein
MGSPRPRQRPFADAPAERSVPPTAIGRLEIPGRPASPR